jgi:hypothetical protein
VKGMSSRSLGSLADWRWEYGDEAVHTAGDPCGRKPERR